MTPRVVVVIPCFNDGGHVREAIASIDEAEPVEVVVVDDASTDRTTLAVLDALREEGTTVVRHERNRGLPDARNTGVAAATAPYVFPLDSDDLAVPGALSAMADRLDADPGAAVCFGDYVEFGSYELLRTVPLGLDPYRIAYANEYPVSSLFRRTVLQQVGGWRAVTDGAPGYEDWDLWMGLAERGLYGVHLGPGTVSYRRRVHDGRMLAGARKRHAELYGHLRRAHPQLFADLHRHRRESSLSPLLKAVYPAVYGGRPRLPYERNLKRWIDRRGIWAPPRGEPSAGGGGLLAAPDDLAPTPKAPDTFRGP